MKMSVSEDWAARRQGKIFCVESECRSVMMLRLCPWQAKEWALPWSRFEAATFNHEDESERIEIFFAHHHVIVIGKNLRNTMDDIRVFQVRCLRDVPASLYLSVDPKEPLIEKLEVRLLNESKQGPADGLPF